MRLSAALLLFCLVGQALGEAMLRLALQIVAVRSWDCLCLPAGTSRSCRVQGRRAPLFPGAPPMPVVIRMISRRRGGGRHRRASWLAAAQAAAGTRRSPDPSRVEPLHAGMGMHMGGMDDMPMGGSEEASTGDMAGMDGGMMMGGAGSGNMTSPCYSDPSNPDCAAFTRSDEGEAGQRRGEVKGRGSGVLVIQTIGP